MNRTVALVVRGGWPGHAPIEQTDAVLPYLSSLGLEVVVSDDLDSYADTELMSRAAIVVQSWTMGEISDGALDGLLAAVAAGAGFAGWHGGIVDSFRASPGYLQLTGGQFVDHPGGAVQFEVTVRPEARSHEVTAGIERFSMTSEQYWVLTDAHNTVLAETTVAALDNDPWVTPITVPAVWTRTWGSGRVFVSTLGHEPRDLDVPEVRLIVERGMLWAAHLTS